MSTRKTSITVSLVCTLLIMGYYLINIIPMFLQSNLIAKDIFRIAGITIIASIIMNIAGNIITNIVIYIIHAIQTQSNKELRMLEDERDKLIGLKGSQVSYVAYSIGVLIAMLTFVFGQPPLMMFSLIVFFSLLTEIISALAQFYFYSKGI